MHRTTTFVALFSLILLGASPYSGPSGQSGENDVLYSGTTFQNKCQLNTTSVEALMCSFYVSGVADGYELSKTEHGIAPSICIPREPNGASPLQVARVAKKYIEDHPAKADLTVAELSRMALEDAFPCKAD